MSVASDFKAFVARGNVVDLAVGVIIGAAFGKITTSLVNDILMPPLGLLTGKVDFTRSIGTAQAVTTYTDGRPQETRTLFFTPEELWFGDVPGLAGALTAAALPPATFVRRPLGAQGTSPQLVDVLAQLVLNLSARTGDDPRAFLGGGYTWQGQRSINGHLAAVYKLASGPTVAVSASDQLLLQYVTPLPDQDFQVTITLADHGGREVELPADADTLNAGDHPEVAAQLGM